MSSRGAITGARRAARVRRIVEDVMVRRGRGEALPDAEVTAAHPDLMPELAKELSLLGLLQRAKNSATGRTSTGRRSDAPIEPLGEDAFAGFRVVGEVRRGGQGVVYDAVQSSTGRRVAIKMMREGHFAGDRDAARFEREVRILGQLDHPGVVGILASGIRGGHFYYVMDFVDGVPLDQFAADIGRGPREVMRVMEKVAEAVNAAHLRGIIHRDLKPGNILVNAAGQARILDFGLARMVSENDARMTATGQFVGSMPWASPEQASGDQAKIDLRTDVYSLGVILYHALTGRFPYDVDTGPRETLENIAHARPARLRSSSGAIDPGIQAITLKCLRKEPEQRYQSAGDLAADIRRFLSGWPVLAHPPSFWYQARSFARRHRAWVGGGVGVLAALVLGLIGTSAGLVRASSARRAALSERDEAQRHAYAASIAAADSALRVDDSGTAKAQLRSAPEGLRGWEWRYLAARADQSVTTLALPRVWDSKVTPDGRSVLSIVRDRTVRLTDLSGEATLWSSTLEKHAGNHQFVLAFSRDGLAITQHDTMAVVWRLSDGSRVKSLDIGGSWGFASASFSPDGTRVLTSGRDSMLQVWDLATGKSLLSRPLGAFHSVGADYNPDGAFIAASVRNGVDILDARTLETVRELRTATPYAPDWAGVRYSPDGKWVVANCGTSIVALDPDGRSPSREFTAGSQAFVDFSLDSGGGLLAAGSWDRTARVWDFATGRLAATLVGHEERVLSATFAGEQLISAGADGSVKRWDHREEKGVYFHSGAVLADLLPAGDRALFWGYKSCAVVDLGAGRVTKLDTPEGGETWSRCTSPDGRFMASAGAGSDLWVMNLGDSSVRWQVECPGPVLSTRFSPDGAVLAAVSKDVIEFRDSATGALQHSERCSQHTHSRLWYHPAKAEIIITAFWNSFIVLDTATWTRRVVDYREPVGQFVAIACTRDGALAASCDTTGGAVIWDARSWTPVRRLSGMPPVAWCAAFSPDGSRLAIGSQDRTIHIFETKEWRETLILRGHTGSVNSVEWTPDGSTLVSAANDGTLRKWDAAAAKWDAGAKGK